VKWHKPEIFVSAKNCPLVWLVPSQNRKIFAEGERTEIDLHKQFQHISELSKVIARFAFGYNSQVPRPMIVDLAHQAEIGLTRAEGGLSVQGESEAHLIRISRPRLCFNRVL
jgi:hypothetical protein